MRTIKTVFLFLVIFTITSCSKEAEPIQYGNDQCNFCKMNVVDKAHSAQYVTKKGKQFKYDAIECMVNEINKLGNINDLAVLLVADFGNPGAMVDAKTATYLISKGIKSPMGAFLSGFSDKAKAEENKSKFGGQVFDWNSLVELFKNQ